MDTTRLIWEDRYVVRVPFIDTCSTEYLKIFGTPTTGDTDFDKAVNNELVTIAISINEMVEYYRRGVNIRIVTHSDIKVIYDSISAHLQAWANMLRNGLNIGDAPITDLVDMDKFANVVYEHAKYHFTADTVGSVLAENMNRLGVTKDTFFRQGSAGALLTDRLKNPNAVVKRDRDGHPDRPSYAELFKSRVRGGR